MTVQDLIFLLSQLEPEAIVVLEYTGSSVDSVAVGWCLNEETGLPNVVIS